MPKILIPIDFSPVSKTVYFYGKKLSEQLQADITVIHVIQHVFTSMDGLMLDQIDALLAAAEARLNHFIEEQGLDNDKQQVVKVVRFGAAGFTIADYANDQQFDYVVTGMRNHHNFLERILGTTSTIITKNTSCPVLLIHENTRWCPPQKIIYTIDDGTDFDESIDRFIKFNVSFNAFTEFVHIKTDQNNVISNQNIIIQEVFKNKQPSFGFDIKDIYGGDIVQSIIDYSIFEKADMLVMVHRKRDYLDTFLTKSLSIRTAEGIHLPIMVLEENPPSHKQPKEKIMGYKS